MAALPTLDRQRVWRGLMRFWSRQRESVAGATKADLRAAINAADDWLDTNAALYNAALPLITRTNLTTAQKGFVLACVALLRSGNSELLRALLGEVD